MMKWLPLVLAAVAVADDVEWRRTPVATAPLLAQAPAIDGNVGRAEWQGAALLGPFKTAPEGAADEFERQCFVGYDAQNLYIAFCIERPAQVRQPMSPAEAGHVDSWRGGDLVEVAIDPQRTRKRYFNFALYASGAFGEGLGQPSTDRNWNAPWRQAARVTETGWEGEMAIPFASLQTEPPKPGDVWGFDVVDNQRTPFKKISQWSFRGRSWHDFANFGVLRFGGPATPAARFVQAREAGEGKLAVEFELVNANAGDAAVEADITLLRRKPGASGGPKSFYESVDSGGDQDYAAGRTDFYKGTKLAEVIADALKCYEAVEGAQRKQSVAVPAGQRRGVGLLQPAGPGEYLVVFQLRGAGGEPLAQGVTPFRVEAPLALTLEPYWLGAQVIDVRADLRKVAASSNATATFSIRSTKTELEQRVAVPADAKAAQAALPTGKLPPGFYRVRVVVNAADGKELAAAEAPVEKPPLPPWHNNTEGKKLAVSKPWTPVVATRAGRVEMWGRVYQLDGFFPTRIVSQGHELLPSPASFEVFADGKPLAWTVKSLELAEATAGRAVYRATLENERATLSGTVTVEFDGLAWYAVELRPRGGPLQVERARLTLPVSPQRAKLMDLQRFLDDPAFGDKPLVPVKGGQPGPAVESLMPFTPYLWVGDERAGLAFTAEGPVNWKLQKPAQALEVQAGAMRINFIDHATKLEKPLALQFGLMASPYRPMPRAGVDHLVQIGGPSTDEQFYKDIAALGGKSVVFHGGWKGSKASVWSGWPSQPPEPKRREELKQGIALAHRHGLTVSLYTGWGVAADSDEWKHFGREMTRAPAENSGFGTWRQAAGLQGAYADYMAWMHAQLIREYGYDGVFWDSAANLFTDQNLRIGNGWVDEQGRVRPTVPVRATRELFRRVYNLVHGEIKDGGVVVNFAGSVWPVNIYADVFHRGEGRPMHATALREAWEPLEEYRAAYDARKYGLPYLGMNKNFKRLEMSVNNLASVILLHGGMTKAVGGFDVKSWNYEDRGQPIPRFWQARHWLPLDETARLFLYHEGQRAVRVEPASLLGSAFVSADGKRALVVVSNLDRQPVKNAIVRLDLPAMGMNAAGALRVEDAVLAKPVVVRDGVLNVEIEAERYRLLKLSVE
jgi:hypothetical protein